MELYWPQIYRQRFVRNKALLILLYSPDALYPKFAGHWDCYKHEEKSHDFAMLVFKVRFYCCAIINHLVIKIFKN